MLILLTCGLGKCCGFIETKRQRYYFSNAEIDPNHFEHYSLNREKPFDSDREVLFAKMHLKAIQ